MSMFSKISFHFFFSENEEEELEEEAMSGNSERSIEAIKNVLRRTIEGIYYSTINIYVMIEMH